MSQNQKLVIELFLILKVAKIGYNTKIVLKYAIKAYNF